MEELWYVTIPVYDKQRKSTFLLNLLSVLKLGFWCYLGVGHFPMSLKASEKTKHVVTKPLVTLSILVKISTRLEFF